MGAFMRQHLGTGTPQLGLPPTTSGAVEASPRLHVMSTMNSNSRSPLPEAPRKSSQVRLGQVQEQTQPAWVSPAQKLNRARTTADYKRRLQQPGADSGISGHLTEQQTKARELREMLDSKEALIKLNLDNIKMGHEEYISDFFSQIKLQGQSFQERQNAINGGTAGQPGQFEEYSQKLYSYLDKELQMISDLKSKVLHFRSVLKEKTALEDELQKQNSLVSENHIDPDQMDQLRTIQKFMEDQGNRPISRSNGSTPDASPMQPSSEPKFESEDAHNNSTALDESIGDIYDIRLGNTEDGFGLLDD